jgi:hypothetical protein
MVLITLTDTKKHEEEDEKDENHRTCGGYRNGTKGEAREGGTITVPAEELRGTCARSGCFFTTTPFWHFTLRIIIISNLNANWA